MILSRFDGRQPAATAEHQAVGAGAGSMSMRSQDATVTRSGGGASSSTASGHVGIGAPLWWGRGPDGWPLLAVSLGGWHQRR